MPPYEAFHLVDRYNISKQVAQWATIVHLGASIMFRDSITYESQKQVTLNLKQLPGINSKT